MAPQMFVKNVFQNECMQACPGQFYVAVKIQWNNVSNVILHTQKPFTSVREEHFHSLLDFYPPLLLTKIDCLLSAEWEA